jgi:hypothetical protein
VDKMTQLSPQDRCRVEPKYLRKGSLMERFNAMWTPVTESGCWLWNGGVNSRGYAEMSHKGKSDKAHRISYRLYKGEIPDGLCLDHLCRVKCCVNPYHLEAVTSIENIRRATPYLRKKTHCLRGHELSGDNLASRKDGARHCKKCAAFRQHQLDLKARNFRPPIPTKRRPIVGTHSVTGEKLFFKSVKDAGRAGFNKNTIFTAIKKGFKHAGYYWEDAPNAENK